MLHEGNIFSFNKVRFIKYNTLRCLNENENFSQDWIEFEEIADLEERAKSQFFEKAHEEVVLKTQEAAKEKEFQSVPAGPAGAVEVSFSLHDNKNLFISPDGKNLFF